MSVTFKEASSQDIRRVMAMMASFNAIDDYPFDETLTRENLSNFIQRPDLGRVWMIYTDAMIAGYCILAFGFSFEYKGRDAFIDEIYLGEEFRNKGIGKQVVRFIEDQARQLGVKTLHLEVERHNAKANKIYLDHGFSNNDRMLLTKRLS